MRKPWLLSCLIFFFSTSLLSQLSISRNHPELQWQTFNTPHFQIIYHQGLEQTAAQAAIVAENCYLRITADLETAIPGRTPLILSGVDDITNGLANPLNHAIIVWTYGGAKLATDNINWLERVISHEFAHIATFWASRNRLGFWGELITLGNTPLWFLEGVAQYQAETWDAHRNTLLRSAFNSRSLLPAGKLDGYVGTNQIQSRLLYEQGHGLMRYLSQTYGPDIAVRLIQAHRKCPLSFSRTLKKVTGKSMKAIYADWQKSLSVYADTENQRSVTSISTPFQVVKGVRYSPSGRMAVVAVKSLDENLQRLYVYDPASETFHTEGKIHINAFFTWMNDNQLIYSRMHRNKQGSLIHDLYTLNLNTRQETQWTHNQRAEDPAMHPSGSRLCYVRHLSRGSGLFVMDMNTRHTDELFYQNDGSEVFTPSWSADGQWIAFSLIDSSGQRDIGLIRADGSQFKKLTVNCSDNRTPVWHPRDNKLIFCSNQTGTPAIYLMSLDSENVQFIASTRGGYFNPAWQPDGQTLTAINFDNTEKIEAVTLPCIPSDLPAAEAQTPEWAAVVPPGFANHQLLSKKGHSMASPYASFRNIKPLLTLPMMSKDDGGYQFGIAHYAADALDKHQITGYLLTGERQDVYAQYVNSFFLPVMTWTMFSMTQNRGKIINALPSVWQKRTGLSWQLLFPVQWGGDLLSSHILTFHGNCEYLNPFDSAVYSVLKPGYRPFKGLIHETGFSWAYSRQLPDIAGNIHPANGLGLSFSLNRADSRLGSDIERTRLTGSVWGHRRLNSCQRVSANIQTQYQWGKQPFQERLSIQSPYGIRALPAQAHGHRFLIGSLEYGLRLTRDLKFTPPLLYFEQLISALWCDFGKAWGTDIPFYATGSLLDFEQAPWLMTAGIELKTRVFLLGKLPVVIGTGWGRDLLNRDKGRWYVTVGNLY